MKRPLTGLALVYAAGILVGSLSDWPAAWQLMLWAGLLVAFLMLLRTQLSAIALLMLVFAAGSFSYRLATTVSSPLDVGNLLERRDQNVELRGTIVSDTGYRKDETASDETGERLQFKLALAAIKPAEEWRPATGTLLVFVSNTRTNEALVYGDWIECSAILRVPPSARNPGTFDWRAWLARQRIQFTATIRKDDTCAVLGQDRGNSLIALSLRWREQFERALRQGLEDEPAVAGVLVGMVIGQRSDIPPDTYADFQRTGVFHVFAINGLHVGLVMAVVLVLLRVMWVPRRWCGLIAIPLLVVYVFATGAHPGAVRALIMACVWLIGWMLVRPTDSLNNLAAAALVILVWDPTQLFDGGFILSFAVVTAIVVLASRIEPKLQRVIAPDPLLPRKLLPRWRKWIEESARPVVRLLSCSLAAWVGLVPLLAVYFHLFTPVSIVGNLLVIPMLTAIIALGLLATLAYPAWPWLTLTFNNANFFLLGAMTRGVDWLSRLPGGHWFVQPPPLWLVWSYYAMGVLLLSQRISWHRRRWAAAIGVPVIGGALFIQGWRQEAVEITVLDLNDGLSVFVNVPGEQHDALVDGGGNWSGRRAVTPFLRAQGVDQLGTIILTCGDKAHAAGLNVVAGEIPVGQAIHTSLKSRSKYYRQWLEFMQTGQVPIRTMRAGEDFFLGPNVRLRALHPPAGAAFSDRSDDNSLVLAIEYGPNRVLVMSDAGETVERHLLLAGASLPAQLIVRGQHGKESSCTPRFLDAVQPTAVVLAVNTHPHARYPEPGLRERLARRGIGLYRTDEVGAVTIRLTDQGYTIRTWLNPS